MYNTVADPFTVAGSGSEPVSQIDLPVTFNAPNLNTFYASIWTDVDGALGSQVPGAYWSLSTDIAYGTCCSLVSVTDISGVTLVGGEKYFMVLGPLSSTDSSWVEWATTNNPSYVGDVITTPDGGGLWGVFPGFSDPAFDVLSNVSDVPEPSMVILTSLGIAVMVLRRSVLRH